MINLFPILNVLHDGKLSVYEIIALVGIGIAAIVITVVLLIRRGITFKQIVKDPTKLIDVIDEVTDLIEKKLDSLDRDKDSDIYNEYIKYKDKITQIGEIVHDEDKEKNKDEKEVK